MQAPTSVALFFVMATRCQSPNLSPTNKVLPLIIADGRVLRKTMACNFGGAGLAGANSTAGAAEATWTAAVAGAGAPGAEASGGAAITALGSTEAGTGTFAGGETGAVAV